MFDRAVYGVASDSTLYIGDGRLAMGHPSSSLTTRLGCDELWAKTI